MGLLATILAVWKSEDKALGISAGVLAATAADALWPELSLRGPGGDTIEHARGSGNQDSSPAL